MHISIVVSKNGNRSIPIQIRKKAKGRIGKLIDCPERAKAMEQKNKEVNND